MVRLKHRYLLVNILYPDPKTSNVKLGPSPGGDVPLSIHFRQPSSDNLNIKIVLRLIRDGVAELFGDYGSGKVAASLQIKYFSAATSTAIVRVARDHYRLVWAALTFITRLPRPLDQPCVVQVVRVSGTIRKAEEEAIRRARVSIRRAQRAAQAEGNAGLEGPLAALGAIDGGEEEDYAMIGGIEDRDQVGDVDEDEDDESDGAG